MFCHQMPLESQFFCVSGLRRANAIGRFSYIFVGIQTKVNKNILMNLGQHIKTQEKSQVLPKPR